MTAALIFAALLAPQAPAAEGGAGSQEAVQEAQAQALDLEELQDAAEEQGQHISLGTGLEEGLQELWAAGSGSLTGTVRQALASGVLLLAVVALCGLAGEVEAGLGRSAELSPANVTAAVAVTAVAVADVHALVGLGRQALEQMHQFSQILLPTVAAAAAASGAPGGASARQLATMLFADILLTVIDTLLLPLVYAYVAACTARAALGNEGLGRLAGLLKWAVTAVLTALLVAFVSYLTVSGVIAGTADALTLKAAKMTISGMVPVVGGILSDAAGTVLAGAGVLRNTVGVFGMLAVLGMCLLPFLQLGIHYLVYKLTSALAATVSQGPASGLIDQIGGAFGLVLGMTGAGALLLLVSLVSAISLSVGGS